MSTDMVDLATAGLGSDTAVDTTSSTVDTSSTDTSTQDTHVETNDTPEIDAESDGSDETGKETETHNADGSEKSAEEQAEFKSKAAAEKVPASIQEQRAALKELRELDPTKYGKIVKTMHNAIERWNAASELLGKGEGNGIVALKSFMADAGAKSVSELRQAYEQSANLQNTVKETDEMLYEASPEIATNVYDDMKANGVEANYPKVITNFLQHLKQVDAAGYYGIAQGSALEAMEEAGFASAANQAFAQLNAGDVKGATATLRAVGKWFTDLRDSQSSKAKEAKELSKLEEAKKSWESDKASTERTKSESSVAEEADKTNNTLLGKELGSFLKLPYFKEFKRESLLVIGNQIKGNLYNALKQDKQYQSTMNQMFKAKTLDSAKIQAYHKQAVEQKAAMVVRNTIQTMYPGYAKQGTAAGRVASAQAKTTANTKAAAQSVSSGKPIYVATRPTNLVRESVTVNGKDYSQSDLVTLQIAGRGFVKTTDGKGFKLVTWRRG